MTPAPLELESRDCPATWYGGEFWLPGVGAVRPFEGWHGTIVVAAGAERVYVGAGPGGGPRIATLDAATGSRTTPDYWAGDPADRSGVVFVQPPAGRPDPPGVVVPVAPIALGPPDGFTVYVDFESDPFDRGEVMAGLHALLPDLRITDARPDLRPDLYGTAVFGAPLGHDDRGPAGIAYADWTDGQPHGVSEAVFVDARHVATADGAARMLAHEISHALKLIPDEV